MTSESEHPTGSGKHIEADLSGSGTQTIGDNNFVLGQSSFYNSGTIEAINHNHYHSPDFIERLYHEYLHDVQTQYRAFWQQHITPLEDQSTLIPQPISQLFYADWFQDLHSHYSQQADQTAADNRQVSSDNSLHAILQLLRDREIPKQFDKKGIVVIGEPGAGKTVALRHVAAVTANQLEAKRPYIPIYLPLNQYAGQTDFASFIGSSLKAKHLPSSFSQLAEHLPQILPHQRWLLLLDGYNEIGESIEDKIGHRRAFLRALQQFSHNFRVQFVLSSRENFASDLVAYPTITLRPLSQLGVEQCLHLYAPEHAPDILQQIARQPALHHLVSNPFRAKSIAQIYAPGTTIPTTAVSLYEQLVSHLVQHEKRRCLNNGIPFRPLEVWQPTILQTAATMHLTHTTADQRAKYEEQESDLASAEQCGLLQPLTTQVQFIHHQLQEYFAALWVHVGIQQEGLHSERLKCIWQDRYWDEAILLVCTLLTNEDLSQLIVFLAKYDPYLAARAVGQTPERITPAVRHWLAAYLDRGWRLVYGEEDAAMRALGAMRCREGFEQLEKRADVKDYTVTDFGEKYLTAVSQYDYETAARFIANQLREAVKWDEVRGRGHHIEYTIFTKALGQMKTPYARAFLIQALQDRKLTKAALVGIVTGRFHEAIPILREMLDSAEFEEICAAIGEAQFTALVPDLLPYAEQYPAAMTAVLRLNGGQAVIDAAAYFQQSLTQQYQFKRDLDLLGISNWYETRLSYFLYLEHVAGPEKASQFLDFMLFVAEHGSLQGRAQAIALLLFVRHSQLADLLDKAAESPISDSHSLESQYQKIARVAKTILSSPLQTGFSADPIIRFAILLCHQRALPPEIDLPTELTAVLQTAAVNRQQVGQWAMAFLQHQKTFTDNPQLVLDAMSVLVELAWPDMVYRLMTAVTQCDNAWTPRNDTNDYRRIAWLYVPLFVSYAEQNEAHRQQVLQAVAPQVHKFSRWWPHIAIEICVALKATQYLEEWLRYLRTSSWQKGYTVVNAFGRLDVPPSVTEKLVKRLASQFADERFFAVLALGEMREAAVLSDLLAMKQERDKQVQWALVWAIGQISITPATADFLATAATWNNGRARREVAHAIGSNEYRPLTSLLYQLLDDPDLRVVERAVWAFGRLGETAVANTLSKMLNIAKHRGQMTSYHLKRRVETNLQQTLTIALTRIKQGGNQTVFTFLPTQPMVSDPANSEEKTQQEKDLETVTENIPEKLSAICRGLMLAEQSINRDESLPLMTVVTEKEIKRAIKRLDNMRQGERERQIYEADLPQVRLKALELSLAEAPPKESYDASEYLTTNIRRAHADPSPKVRLLAYSQNPYGSNNRIDLDISPKHISESLTMAWSRIQENTDLSIITRSFELKEWGGLLLARSFANEFDVTELHDALLDQYPWQQPQDHVFAFLAETLPPEQLAQLTLLWRQHIRNPEWYGWQMDSPPTLNPLAGRHQWGIVTDLAHMLLGTANAAEDAAYALIEMGVYQAAVPIEKAMQTSTKQLDQEMVNKPIRTYIEAVAQVELRGATSEIVPPEIMNQTERYDPQDSVLWDHFGDLLCEVDSLTPPAEWAEVQRQVARDHYGENDRYRAIKRGLRKWGLAALTQFFAQDDAKFNAYNLGYIRDIALDPKAYAPTSFIKTVREIMRDARTYPDTIFVGWLTHPQIAMRLWGLFTLAARQFPIPIPALHTLFADNEDAIGYALVHCVQHIPTLNVVLHKMAQDTPEFETEVETAVSEKLTHFIINLLEDANLATLRLLTNYRLPQFDPYILQWITQDEFGDDWKEVELLIHFDTVLGNRETHTKILRLLQEGKQDVMAHLLERGDRGFGTHLASLLKMPEEDLEFHEPDNEDHDRL